MNGMYLYIILTAITTLLQAVTAMAYVNITLGTSQNSHDISVAAVIKTPMDFFYANPVGRILNRNSSIISQGGFQLTQQNI